VFYESPRRLAASLSGRWPKRYWGRTAPAAVCRELTKRFEEVRRGSLATLAGHYGGSGAPKGEVVVVVAPPEVAEASGGDLDAALEEALGGMSVREAAGVVAEALGVPKRRVYARALELARRR
jgi:16S rRNA (cytidine1402-2'-O)-methyltransferase